MPSHENHHAIRMMCHGLTNWFSVKHRVFFLFSCFWVCLPSRTHRLPNAILWTGGRFLPHTHAQQPASVPVRSLSPFTDRVENANSITLRALSGANGNGGKWVFEALCTESPALLHSQAEETEDEGKQTYESQNDIYERSEKLEQPRKLCFARIRRRSRTVPHAQATL